MFQLSKKWSKKSCDECFKYSRSGDVMKRVQNMDGVEKILEVCQKRCFTKDDVENMKNVVRTPTSGMSAAKAHLVEQVKRLKEFSSWSIENEGKLQEMGVTGGGASPDEFLKQFGNA
eukprot:GHVU01003865.1.p1 GENE.GHVU01003865.1~~GHVU01003865.1.p1  ORF type:complete len:117 (-),score=20.01 GHVU01003865.1:152-502(-)